MFHYIAVGIRTAIRSLVILGVIGSAAGHCAADANDADSHWSEFRKLVPGHFQDWILAGEGPQFTLIYSEPPPAYSLEEYAPLLARVFRGYKQHVAKTRPLGHNGSVSDLVIQLDYGFTGEDALAALQADLMALSRELYGTSHGARLLALSELAENPPSPALSSTVHVSAPQLDTWLFGDKDQLTFVAPETGVSGQLTSLLSSRTTGRYLSADNSLVILVVRLDEVLNSSVIADVRRFAIDSDLILGGAIDDNVRAAALVGRARQLSLADCPPLRVEDVFNAMTSKDRNWAQSYDRTTPGAGRARMNDDAIGDWAPSFLSADLLDTEFGSLLNHADAILKSQSLSHTVAYNGYDLIQFLDPPFKEGVFDHFQATLQQSSLTFNFNTVGCGHWLLSADSRHRTYALNSTGSFMVTYSPDSTGRNSALSSAATIDEAERLYAEWFEKQRNSVLVRTVQYMGVYQFFGTTPAQGQRLYPDRQELFQGIGDQLRESIKAGVALGLKGSSLTDEELFDRLQKLRRACAADLDYVGDLPQMPASMDELSRAVADAATSVRYDGNLFGARLQVLYQRYNAVSAQLERVYPEYERLYAAYEKSFGAFTARYKKWEVGRVPEAGGERIEYKVPDSISSAFIREKQALAALADRFRPIEAFVVRADNEKKAAERECREAETEVVSRDLLLLAIDRLFYLGETNPYTTSVQNEFATRTHAVRQGNGRRFAIETPTIVVSHNTKREDSGVGGHNVEVQDFKVRVDARLSAGRFRFDANSRELAISEADAPKVGRISASMARVADADPQAQQEAFARVTREAAEGPGTRVEALRLEPPPTDTDPVVGPVEAMRLAVNDVNAGEPIAEGAILFGRDATTSRVYLRRSSGPPVTLFGAHLTPEIIADTLRGRASGEVILDSSLSASDKDAIVANYKHASAIRADRIQVEPGGSGGWRKPPAGGPPPPPGEGKPRLVWFIDQQSGQRRVIVETNRGRVEVLAQRGAKAEDILAALNTRIEPTAELELAPIKAHKSGQDSTLLSTAFKIQQATPVNGTVVARTSQPVGVVGRIASGLRDLCNRAFRNARSAPDIQAAAADFIVELNRDSGALGPEWKVEGAIRIGETGLRFVIDVQRIVPSKDSDGLLANAAN